VTFQLERRYAVGAEVFRQTKGGGVKDPNFFSETFCALFALEIVVVTLPLFQSTSTAGF
jgi:hypothetical protein